MNNPYSNWIFYACIAKGTTVLAEFISKDVNLGDIALKCLGKTPQFHSVFSHTIRNKTYLFLIDNPFVYFGIFDVNLEKSLCVSFLKSVADSFNVFLDQYPVKRLANLNPHCFQGELNPVFHQLLASNLDGPDDVGKLVMSDESGSSRSVREKKVGSFPLLGGLEKNVMKKKKRRFFGERDPPVEKKVDVSCDDGISLTREFYLVNNHNKNGLLTVDKAKRVWKKQLWMVLSLDLIVCCIMFGVWLGICRGFKCMSE